MTEGLDVQADALLETLVQQHGGDLRAAFALLCQRVPAADVIGERYETALARAVAGLFGQPLAHGIGEAAAP